MRRSVLRSIKPYWVFLIIAREMGWDAPQGKTIEVGKSRPCSVDWNRQTYIYCSKDKKSFKRIPEQYQPLMKPLLGKVVGEFFCDYIITYKATKAWSYYGKEIHYLNSSTSCTCLSPEEIEDYGKGKSLYGWHISNLKIYNKPKKLSEFKSLNNLILTRPPQSWYYVRCNND